MSNFNRSGKKTVVLLSPLDWGLGHTTRCIPIIHELINVGCTVIIACNSTQKALLITEFPELTYVHLQGYDLRYGKTRWGTLGRILQQLPKILIKINNENKWLNIFLKQHAVDIIISDNRFGLYSRSVCSIFITHQLYIKTGLGKVTDRFVQWLNYKRISRFTTCWVPDFKGRNALAGKLSNPHKMPVIPVQYLGGLSRLQPCTGNNEPIDILIILSGPEPQRTLFEQQFLKEIKQYTGKVTMVRGLPQSHQQVQCEGNLTIYNHAPAALLNKLICSAEYIISRSGYTTVMDLLKLGKKGIFVPTPGQAEQEYLADHLYKEKFAYTVPQHHFSLQNALQAARKFQFKKLALPMEEYKGIIQGVTFRP
jgi:UDP-N-acetylglucosamine transferase subunit ALG13